MSHRPYEDGGRECERNDTGWCGRIGGTRSVAIGNRLTGDGGGGELQSPL